jgi:hypothetical protein
LSQEGSPYSESHGIELAIYILIGRFQDGFPRARVRGFEYKVEEQQGKMSEMASPGN